MSKNLEVSGSQNKPIAGTFVESICQSKPKNNICQFSIQIYLPQKEFQSDTLENIDAFYQMLGTCGPDEPLCSPKKPSFSFVIAHYFWSYVFEHPVC